MIDMYNSPFVSFDLETTGVDPWKERIVTSSCILMEMNDRNDNTNFTIHNDRTLVADPGVEIPEGAAAVHGYTTERARAEGADHDEVVQDIINTLYWAWDQGMPVVVFNASYDLTMMSALRPDFEIKGLVVDPFVLDKGVDKYRRGKRKLVNVSEHYGVPLSEDDAHGSSADSIAAGQVAAIVVDKMSKHGGRLMEATMEHGTLSFADVTQNIENMMRAQEYMAREQKTSLAQYLNKGVSKDSPVYKNIPIGWPVEESPR